MAARLEQTDSPKLNAIGIIKALFVLSVLAVLFVSFTEEHGATNERRAVANSPVASDSSTSAISPTPRPAQEKSSPGAEATKSTTLGLSYDQVTKSMGQLIKIEKSSDVNGQPRYMGTANNKLAILEVIGNKKDVSHASLMLGLPNDSPVSVITNSALLIRFMKNVVPERANSFDWVASATKEATSSGVPVGVVVGHKRVKFQVIESMGMFLVSVKHKDVAP